MQKKYLLVIILFFVKTVVSQTTYYVDAARPNNTGAGTSWASAKKDVQNAIALAVSGDQVWVKAGTYLPTLDPFGSSSPANNRDKTFTLKEGVKVYGGFAGTETLLSQRNWETNLTTLSGDLGTLNTLTDNAYHVVISVNLTSATVLDGFTISKGYATAINGSAITVGTRTISRHGGGGIYNANSATGFSNCIINANNADVTNTDGDALGAGMVNQNCTSTFTNCTIDGNSFLIGGASFGVFGAGMYIEGGACVLNSCVFTNNTSGSGFIDGTRGGAVFMSSGNSSFTNCIFYNNSSQNGAALGMGGGEFNTSSFNNCTFANNTSSFAGTSFSGFADAVFKNCIFWNNTPTSSSVAGRNEIYSQETRVAYLPTFTNCIIRDASGSPLAVTNTVMSGALNGNPLFANISDGDGTDNKWGTSDDGLLISTSSPARNSGTTGAGIPSTDFRNLTRDAQPDIGAYEFLITTTTTWNGSTWSNGNPSSTIDAIIASNTAPASFTCKALTINSTFALTTTGITATVNGDITNNGNGIAGTGNVVIAANAALQGTAFSFSGNLTVNTGATLTTNDKLTLASDATNTGRVGNSTGSIAGNVTVQRFISAGRRSFRFLAHPFTSNLAMSILTDDIDITGTGGTPFTTTTTNAPSAFSYNNATANSSLTSDPGWTGLTSTSNFNAKTGYRVLVRGTKGQTNSLNGGSYTPAAVTLDWTGTLNQGQQVFTLSRTNANAQYNLIGNPYACPVDLSLTTRGSNINANFSVWNPNILARGGYETQAFSTPYILPSGSAFFAQTAGNTNNAITFDEVDKSTGSPTNIFRTTSTDEVLSLQINDANGNYADKLSFLLSTNNRNYTEKNDVLWDAEKLMNPEVNLYSFSSDGTKLAIDRRPNDFDIIKLGFTAATGSYSFVIKELPMSSNTNYYLKDNYLQTTTLLNTGTAINVTINNEATSQGNARFELITKLAPSISRANQLNIKLGPNPARGKTALTYTQPDVQNTTITITDVTGKKVQTINLGKVQNGVQPLNTNKLAAGTYYVQVSNGVETKTEKLIVQ